MWRYFGNQAV